MFGFRGQGCCGLMVLVGSHGQNLNLNHSNKLKSWMHETPHLRICRVHIYGADIYKCKN